MGIAFGEGVGIRKRYMRKYFAAFVVVMERPAHTTYKSTPSFFRFWGIKSNRRIIWLNNLLTYHIAKYFFLFKNISTLATEVSVCSPLVAKRSDANALSLALPSCQLWKSDTLLLTGMKGLSPFLLHCHGCQEAQKWDCARLMYFLCCFSSIMIVFFFLFFLKLH